MYIHVRINDRVDKTHKTLSRIEEDTRGSNEKEANGYKNTKYKSIDSLSAVSRILQISDSNKILSMWRSTVVRTTKSHHLRFVQCMVAWT